MVRQAEILLDPRYFFIPQHYHQRLNRDVFVHNAAVNKESQRLNAFVMIFSLAQAQILSYGALLAREKVGVQPCVHEVVMASSDFCAKTSITTRKKHCI